MTIPTYVSIVDPPDVEPVLSIQAPTIYDGQAAGVISLATARELIQELEAGVKGAERIQRRRADLRYGDASDGLDTDERMEA